MIQPLIVGFDATAILAIADVNQAHAHQFEELAGKTDLLHGEITRVTTSSANEVRSKLMHFEHAIDDIADARYLGTGKAALVTVLDRAGKAQEVRNTLVLFGVPERDMPAVCYTTMDAKSIHDCIGEVLLKGGSWTDIVSQEVVNSPLLEWLGFVEEFRKKPKNDASGIDPADAVSRYRIRRLKESYPVINFMILRYENDKEEVIFGWGHHSEDPGGRVFITQNVRLINMFDLFWRMLEKDSVPFQPDVCCPIAPADITGLWFSVAYETVEKSALAARIPTGSKQANAALVGISVTDNRNITVKGVIFDEDKDGGNLERPLESVSADLKDCQLWFLTKNVGTTFNAGNYHFIHPTRPKPSPNKSRPSTGAGIEEYYGEFFDPVCKTNEVTRLMIFGNRITENWPEENDSTNIGDSLPDDPRRQEQLLNLCRKKWPEVEKSWSSGLSVIGSGAGGSITTILAS